MTREVQLCKCRTLRALRLSAHDFHNLHDFFAALAAPNPPAVSSLKAIAAQNGHAGDSDPLMEQRGRHAVLSSSSTAVATDDLPSDWIVPGRLPGQIRGGPYSLRILTTLE